MNRREFLKRMGALGLVAAAPKLIFDLAPQSYKHSYNIRDMFLNDPDTEFNYYEGVDLFPQEYPSFQYEWAEWKLQDPSKRVGGIYVIGGEKDYAIPT